MSELGRDDKPTVPSPCIRACCLDDDDVCLGCYRNLQEIIDWQGLGDAERRAVLGSTVERRRARGRVL